ncbi:lytic cellulose monooxygenase (C1-hydroxylating) [Microdochium nivale]|nr:lytic cellulose monooxygenase (C1-hydroxylating) [Microdochium nivale]
MKASTLFGAALAFHGASAHYFMDTVTYKGQTTPSFRYIRDFTRQTKYNPIKFSSNPAADIRDRSTIDGEDARCNQGAFSKAGSTQVLTVNAGEEVRVNLALGAKMEHPGPTIVYMSRAPGDNVKGYRGDGDWFKVKQEGVCNQSGDLKSTAWCSWAKNFMTATIPKDVPTGEYLMRFEHIGVHRSHVNQPEHYVSCVQLKVQGGGRGTPGPMVKFPGAYKASDPYANFSVYNGMKAFPMPGPALYAGGGSRPASTDDDAVPAPTPAPVTTAAPDAPAPTAADPAPAPPAGGDSGDACAALFGRCGGMDWQGAKCCSQGACKAANEYYSQCL